MNKKTYLLAACICSLACSLKAQNTFNNSGANVGIGTMTPQSPFTVIGSNGGSAEGYTATFNSNLGSNTGVGNQLNISNNTHWGLLAGFDGPGVTSSSYHGPNYGYLINIQNAPLLLGTNNSTNMAMLPSGNVGIGTMTPISTFNVSASSGSQITFSNNSPTLTGGENQSLVFNGLNNGGNGGTPLELLKVKVTSTNGGIALGRVDFIQNGNSVSTLTFLPNLNIGIGTSAPDEKLTVKGTIHSQAVKVDLNVPGPDYVFKKSYLLPKLSEVKSYIAKNHHLSEIPSAVQMAKNGVDLGEMNIKLLKKVEELTLYLLEEHEQNQKQKVQITKLNQKVVTLLKNSRIKD